MERLPVSSKSLSSVGYDPDERVLEVEFSNGHVYRYFEVSPEVYDDLIHSESHGKYLNENIRDIYRYEQVS